MTTDSSKGRKKCKNRVKERKFQKSEGKLRKRRGAKRVTINIYPLPLPHQKKYISGSATLSPCHIFKTERRIKNQTKLRNVFFG